MKKFLVLYHSPEVARAEMSTASPEQKQEGMKPWMAWKDKIGNKLVDFGAPLKVGARIRPDGHIEKSKKEVSGYSMIQAKDINEAEALLKEHPHLKWNGGCDIELHEVETM
jgi:hypothetical protein